MGALLPINDQPIAAGFFGEGRWLTDFITPKASDVSTLYKQIAGNLTTVEEKAGACWKWVATQVKYVKFVKGKIWISGKWSVQNDLWTYPSMTIQTKVGNCAVKSFLLASLLRNELGSDEVYCTMGNLYNGKPGGHAWVSLKRPEGDYIMESTVSNVPAMVPANRATRYEPVHHFNDEEILAVEGKTQLMPMASVYSSWLSSYLNWAYIEGGERD